MSIVTNKIQHGFGFGTLHRYSSTSLALFFHASIMYQSRDTLLTPPTLAATLAFLGVWYLITSNIYLTWAAWEPDIRLLSYSYALRPNESKGTCIVGWKSSIRASVRLAPSLP